MKAQKKERMKKKRKKNQQHIKNKKKYTKNDGGKRSKTTRDRDTNGKERPSFAHVSSNVLCPRSLVIDAGFIFIKFASFPGRQQNQQRIKRRQSLHQCKCVCL